MEQDRFIRMPEAVQITGKSRATLYRHMDSGIFPKPRRIGLRAIAWRLSDINRWMDGCEEAGVSGAWLCAAVTGLSPADLLAARGVSNLRDALTADEDRLMGRLRTRLDEYSAVGMGASECKKRLTEYIDGWSK